MEEKKKCPYCGKEIMAVAKKCKHCGKWLATDRAQSSLPVKRILLSTIGIIALLLLCVTFYLNSNGYKEKRIQEELEEMQEIADEERGTPLSASLINGEWAGVGYDYQLSFADGKGRMVSNKGEGIEFKFTYTLREAIHREKLFSLDDTSKEQDTAVWMTISDIDVVKGEDADNIRACYDGAKYRIGELAELKSRKTLMMTRTPYFTERKADPKHPEPHPDLFDAIYKKSSNRH